MASASARFVRGRLLAIDVLAGLDRLADERGAHLRRAGVEEDLVVWIGERGVEIGGPALERRAALPGLELVGVAADQDRVGHHAIAVRQRDAAIGADRQDRADEMLVRPHPAGHAVHDDAETVGRHETSLPRRCPSGTLEPFQ